MNWGKGIAIFMIAFIAFIASMVYHAFTKNADLVDDNYYENELNYDKKKVSKSNYNLLTEKIIISQKEEGVVLQFPESLSLVETGTIKFYRPDQKKYDREFDLKLNEHNFQILEYAHFKEGYYDIFVEWSDGKKSFICEDHMSFMP